MADFELRNSPAPTYSSTLDPRAWPLSPTYKNNASNNPYFKEQKTGEHFAPSRSKTPADDENADAEAPPVKPDYQDPNHPHYAGHASPGQYSPRHRAARRWPQKRVLIPWILAILFFLTTLWFTTVALGARFLNIMHPHAGSQEIHIVLDEGHLREGPSAPIPPVVFSPTPSMTTPPVSSQSSSAHPSTTGSAIKAPDGVPPFEWINPPTLTGSLQQGKNAGPTGFSTIVKRVERRGA